MNTTRQRTVRRRIARRRFRGVGLLDSVMWIGVVVFAFVAIFGMYALVSDGQRRMQTRNLVHQVVTSVRSLYTSSVNYTGLTAAILVNSGMIAEQFVRGTAIETPYGDAVTLGGWDGGWSVGIVNDETDVCIAILSDYVDGGGFFDQLTGAANPAAVPAALVDGSATATTIVASIAAINTACASANKNIILEFR